MKLYGSLTPLTSFKSMLSLLCSDFLSFHGNMHLTAHPKPEATCNFLVTERKGHSHQYLIKCLLYFVLISIVIRIQLVILKFFKFYTIYTYIYSGGKKQINYSLMYTSSSPDEWATTNRLVGMNL